MKGLRFIICATDQEVKAVINYLEGAGCKYKVADKTDLSELSILNPSLQMVWYEGTDIDQLKLVEVTNGISLF